MKVEQGDMKVEYSSRVFLQISVEKLFSQLAFYLAVESGNVKMGGVKRYASNIGNQGNQGLPVPVNKARSCSSAHMKKLNC